MTVNILQTQHSTHHSVHSLPHFSGIIRDQKDLYYSLVDHERDRMRQVDNRYEYHDREREEFERECDSEQKLENERYTHIVLNLNVFNH